MGLTRGHTDNGFRQCLLTSQWPLTITNTLENNLYRRLLRRDLNYCVAGSESSRLMKNLLLHLVPYVCICVCACARGSTVQLSCRWFQVSGSSNIFLRALLLSPTGFNRSIPGYPRYSMTGDPLQGIHNLKIENATLDDDAEYQCQVRFSFTLPLFINPRLFFSEYSVVSTVVLTQCTKKSKTLVYKPPCVLVTCEIVNANVNEYARKKKKTKCRKNR